MTTTSTLRERLKDTRYTKLDAGIRQLKFNYQDPFLTLVSSYSNFDRVDFSYYSNHRFFVSERPKPAPKTDLTLAPKLSMKS